MVDQTNIIVLGQPDAMVTHDMFLSSKTRCVVSSCHVAWASNQPRNAFGRRNRSGSVVNTKENIL